MIASLIHSIKKAENLYVMNKLKHTIHGPKKAVYPINLTNGFWLLNETPASK